MDSVKHLFWYRFGWAGPDFADRISMKTLGGFFSGKNSIESSKPAVVPRYDHLPICSIWICLCAKYMGQIWANAERICLKLMHRFNTNYWCAILIAHQIVMAKHGGSCVHFSGISTCGRTSRETVSHSQRQPLPTPHKIALPVYVTVTNKRMQPLTTTLYNSLVLYFSLFTTKRRLIKHRSFLRVLRSS